MSGYNPKAPGFAGGYLLVGVYAGREGVTFEENSMALGRVWKIEVLESIFGEAVRRRGEYRGPKT